MYWSQNKCAQIMHRQCETQNPTANSDCNYTADLTTAAPLVRGSQMANGAQSMANRRGTFTMSRRSGTAIACSYRT